MAASVACVPFEFECLITDIGSDASVAVNDIGSAFRGWIRVQYKGLNGWCPLHL